MEDQKENSQQDNLGQEQRLVSKLNHYWDSIKLEGQSIPAFSQFNKSDVSDLWQNCVMASVTYVGPQKIYKYEHVGEKAQEAFGTDLTGKIDSTFEKSPSNVSNILKYMDKATAEKKLILSEGQFINHDEKLVKFRDCVLPFTNNNNIISHIIIGLSWKAF
jgi:hypothetical protein